MNIAYNMDCLEYMKTLKDNEFDLIIADPPYGDCDGSWNTPQEVRGGYKVRAVVQEIQKPSGRLHNHGRFTRYCNPSIGGGKTRSVSGLKVEHGQDDTTGVG